MESQRSRRAVGWCVLWVVCGLLGAAALTAAQKQPISPDKKLLQAAVRGDDRSVRVLLAKGASANAANSKGFTALMHAAWRGHTTVVALLLDHGAHPDTQFQNGFTALMLASTNGHTETVRLLIKRRADVNLKAKYTCQQIGVVIHAASAGSTEHLAVASHLARIFSNERWVHRKGCA